MKYCYGLFFILLYSSMGWAQDQVAEELFSRWKNKQPAVHLSQHSPAATLQQAYKVQAEYVALRQKNKAHIAGFKAGLTSAGGQKKFSVQSALAAVLFASGKHQSEAPIALKNFQKLMMETEIGFRLAKPIDKKINTIAELKPYIKSVFPVIELPELAYQTPKAIKGIDLIAANVASNAFILGEEIGLAKAPNLNQLKITLKREKQLINSGKGSDALNDQWQALLWLVNTLVDQQYTLQPEQILITGAIGKMLPAKTGHYHADFGDLGHINYTIVP
ncbi:2-keto-4-pentenoate hydratase [Pleionea sp. CnH1-48]|uniref:2-keto-4-pentenoate hydratase n=1 Tax=Pleionea sp. CnH1-48 TaxID=2954494 RepID=UPI002096E44F|nr:fumarylacetoacetate hydrolase family protein [Pleionea sp. CnH1-48]MCO7227108.1 fumarylacetoacetate hydrolase family protein [Pleionea sp. CnH1-48]